MSDIAILSRMELPNYKPDGTIQVVYSFTVQVDDEMPLTVEVPKEGYNDQALRQAVKKAREDQARSKKELGSRKIPL